jgi:enolase-phosphatase E1
VIRLRAVRAVLTDIEGTTTELEFVQQQLFPYARRELAAYVRAHESELGDILAATRSLAGPAALSTEQLIELLLRWIDEDRKVTPLKSLQGRIWRSGYESGQLRGHVYEDAVRKLRSWHAAGIRIYIYSSGSVEAQQLLFSHSTAGDLTPLISGYFDTTTGPKLESRSYQSIADSVALPSGAIVFLSDHPGETAAAAQAGMPTVLLVRGQPPAATTESSARRFDEIEFTA